MVALVNWVGLIELGSFLFEETPPHNGHVKHTQNNKQTVFPLFSSGEKGWDLELQSACPPDKHH